VAQPSNSAAIASAAGRLHEQDVAPDRGRAIHTGHDHAAEEEAGHVALPGRRGPQQPRGEEAVVQALGGRQHA